MHNEIEELIHDHLEKEKRELLETLRSCLESHYSGEITL